VIGARWLPVETRGRCLVKRYAQLIGLRPEHLEEYVRAHAAVWPGVLATIRDCHIRNYSIFHRQGQLFAYFEYVGQDYEADMAKMADDPETQRWWAWMMPLQEPLADRAEGEWWTSLEEVFHTD
jgi:L-rhamnose mutarotase